MVYRRLVPRLGLPQTVGETAHRLGRLIGKLQGVHSEERGLVISKKSTQRRAGRMILNSLEI
jgi:hypothetical protein